MRRLPSWAQRPLTWLTGKPLDDQEPYWVPTPGVRVAWILASLFGGVAAGVVLFRAGPVGWLGLPVAWLWTAGAARAVSTVLVHHSAHHNVTGRARWDEALGEVFSTLVLIQNMRGYAAAHRADHHGRAFATEDDPDWRFFSSLGFEPGLSRRQLWRRLLVGLISPRFHLRYAVSRLRSNFHDAPRWRVSLALTYAAGLLLAVGWTGGWAEFIIAAVIPAGPLYQVSGLLQLASEHRWLLHAGGQDQRGIQALARLTSARFVGDRVPDRMPVGPRWLAHWARWWFRLLFVHLPVRVLVLPGDVPQHDLHHRRPRGRGPDRWWVWTIAAYERQRAARAEAAGRTGAAPYHEFWGLYDAIDATFTALSRCPARPRGVAAGAGEFDDLILGM